MRAELVAIGNELLDGDIVNRNASWLGAQLAARGVAVTRSTVVGDDEATIAEVVGAGLDRTGLVLTTGGLGPTHDDVTREALAALAGVPLLRDDFLVAQLTRLFAKLGLPMPDSNLTQADLPRGATSLPNALGTAPGLAIEAHGGLVVALPGPPHEMHRMVNDSVLPLLARRGGLTQVLVSKVLHTTALAEASVGEALAPELARLAATPGGPTVAVLASGGITRVKISVSAATAAQAAELIAPVESAARAALGSSIFGENDDSLEAVVLRHLREAGASVACAESLTGGLLTARLTSVPGASQSVRGGVVAYATESKATQLGVEEQALAAEGAVSASTALAMARGVRVRFEADYGLSLTGVAGPDEQEGMAAGTVFVGVAGPRPDEDRTVELSLPGDRERVRMYAVVAALDLLRRTLEQDR